MPATNLYLELFWWLGQSVSNQLLNGDIYHKVTQRTLTEIKGQKPKHSQDSWGLELGTGEWPGTWATVDRGCQVTPSLSLSGFLWARACLCFPLCSLLLLVPSDLSVRGKGKLPFHHWQLYLGFRSDWKTEHATHTRCHFEPGHTGLTSPSMLSLWRGHFPGLTSCLSSMAVPMQIAVRAVYLSSAVGDALWYAAVTTAATPTTNKY